MKKNKNVLQYSESNLQSSKKLYTKMTYFKVLKVAFVALCVYILLVCLTQMWGCALYMDEYSTRANVDEVAIYNESRIKLYSMIISIAGTVATYVMLRLKLSIPFAVLSFVNCIVSFTVFYRPSVINTIQNNGQVVFWGPYGVPSILFAVMGISMGVLMFIDKMNIYKAYDKIAISIYNMISEGGEKQVRPEDYEAALSRYNGEEIFRSDIPLKKSIKRRKGKQKNKQ